VVAGGGRRLAFIAPGGTVRTVEVDVAEITDVAVTPSGRILIADGGAQALVVVRSDGTTEERIGRLASAAGVAAQGETAYVASPTSGLLYRIPLPGGPVETLPISAPDAPVRPVQPSDIALGPDGALAIADFGAKKLLVSPDGASGEAYAGPGGLGALMPHLATVGRLILVTDPTNERIVIFDEGGRQRGVYVFPAAFDGARPVGIAVRDGVVYVADLQGTLHRMRLNIPPELAAELAAPASP
jgi:hypothetical protein